MALIKLSVLTALVMYSSAASASDKMYIVLNTVKCHTYMSINGEKSRFYLRKDPYATLSKHWSRNTGGLEVDILIGYMTPLSEPNGVEVTLGAIGFTHVRTFLVNSQTDNMSEIIMDKKSIGIPRKVAKSLSR